MPDQNPTLCKGILAKFSLDDIKSRGLVSTKSYQAFKKEENWTHNQEDNVSGNRDRSQSNNRI